MNNTSSLTSLGYYDIERVSLCGPLRLLCNLCGSRSIFYRKVRKALAKVRKGDSAADINRGRRPWTRCLAAACDIVGPQCAEIANVKPPVSNYRIRKRPFLK